MSSDDYQFDALSSINGNTLIPTYNIEEDAFLMKIESSDENLFDKNLLNGFDKKMRTWRNNFFVNKETDDSITFCPGPNIEQILFSNGLNFINERQLDLYTLQWLFSVAMGIYILHSNDLYYNELCDKTAFIDTKLNARLFPFLSNIKKGSSTAPDHYYYFSPEQINDFDLPQSKLNKNQKKMSDIYMYGVFLHELVTRRKHYNQYFDNISKFETKTKLKSGAIEYMNLRNEKNIPFLDLLYKCLDPDPNKRYSIEEIIEYLLNINQYRDNTTDSNIYFNINNVDIEKYHQFIIDIIGFKKKMNYESCKNQIYNMMKQKFEPETIPQSDKCTFDDLKDAYSKGLMSCLKIVDQILQKFTKKEKEDYEDFKYNYPQVNEFDILKTFIKYSKNQDELIDELEELKTSNDYYNKKEIGKQQAIDDKAIFSTCYNTKFNTFFTYLVAPINEFHQVISDFFGKVERMNKWEQNFFVKPSKIYPNRSFTYCPGQNIYSLLFSDKDNKIDQNAFNLYKIEWLYSIAMGISILHKKGLKYMALTDKFIFIDYQLKARILSLPYPLDKQLSTTPYRLLFYAPERYNLEFNQIPIKDDLIEKSDVFTYGLIALEIVTKKQHLENLRNLQLPKLYEKFKEGPIKYLELDKNEDKIPLYSIIKRCLNNDPSERCLISEVVDYFLNLQPPQPPNDSEKVEKNNEESFLDLSKVDFDKFHRFIIDIHDLDPRIDYEKAKLIISQVINPNNQNNDFYQNVNTILKGDENICSFKELEIGSKLGISNCDAILSLIENKLPQKVLEKYRKFNEVIGKLSKFELMKICFDNQDNLNVIDKLLDDFLKKYKFEGKFVCSLLNMDNDHNVFKKFSSPEYIELPYELTSDSFHHVVQPLFPYRNRIPSYKYLNLFNFLYGEKKSPASNDINTLTRLNWLLSVAKGINEIHQRGSCMISFSSKNVYIDEDLNATLFMPKTIEMNSINDEDFSENLKMKFADEFDDDNFDNDIDISFFYCSPELFNTSIQKVDHIQCDVYSFGVLAKELIEFNLPWILAKNIPKWSKLNAIKNPHWRHFLKSNFNFFNESSEILNLIEILNNTLEIEPKKRGSLNEICEALSKIIKSQSSNSDEPIFYTTKSKPKIDIFDSKNKNKKVKIASPKNILINQNYTKRQLKETDDRVNRCKCKFYGSKLSIGSMSDKEVRQITLREIYNTECNTELTCMVNNNIGVPSGQVLKMQSIFNALNDFRNQSIFTQPYKTNKKGDAVVQISRFSPAD